MAEMLLKQEELLCEAAMMLISVATCLYLRLDKGLACTGTFDSQLPRLIESLRFSLLHKNRRNFADASPRREDW